ncbi:hypothetical protein D9758_000918 [Tetrapyrgos nigripes]|uniref:Uncharacterized protein n=1 Tax=Tetrapyrgos nigripes TaxID=182062 RepID=A0A8H5GZI2_9AGAR|nr:hypothetical protein D9758_000918 [Tetrapyrgos nigripes]
MGYELSPHEPSVEEAMTSCACGQYTNLKALFLVFFVVALVILVVRLRHPCLTVSSLERFIADLQCSLTRTLEDERRPSGTTTVADLYDDLDKIRHLCEDIVKQKNGNVFRWSLLHRYMTMTFNVLRNVLKCSDEAQVLEVKIKNCCVAVSSEHGTVSPSSPSATTLSTGIELRNTQSAAGTESSGIGSRLGTGTQTRM